LNITLNYTFLSDWLIQKQIIMGEIKIPYKWAQIVYEWSQITIP
jgi:hypothetical protein